jgi:PBP1b-binding outer membrane lipoprotein LpoB
MMKKILLITLFTLVLGACGNGSVEEEAKDVVQTFMKAAEEEDMELLMSTISENGGSYALVKETYERMFEIYDLDYEVEKMTVIESSNKKVVIEVVQTTRKISGPKFNDSRITATHTLVKENGEFKFVDSQFDVDNIELLNEDDNSENTEASK